MIDDRTKGLLSKGITSCSTLYYAYQLYLLEVFSDLSQPHRCVRKNLALFYLLVQNLSKNHLESHRNPRLLQILLEHLGLLLAFSRLVHTLHPSSLTSLSSSSSQFIYCLDGGTFDSSRSSLELFLRGDLGSSFFPFSYFLGEGDLGSYFLGGALGGISVLYLLLSPLKQYHNN